ncbi:hypothetical protein GCM10009688_09700 [Arthrobacter gandavensis]|uniref:Uncharacterized protein n=1 Tax=Arthrobacter gandavensis TaxID=169960 RepID=A0ABN2P1N4_9MICC
MPDPLVRTGSSAPARFPLVIWSMSPEEKRIEAVPAASRTIPRMISQVRFMAPAWCLMLCPSRYAGSVPLVDGDPDPRNGIQA